MTKFKNICLIKTGNERIRTVYFKFRKRLFGQLHPRLVGTLPTTYVGVLIRYAYL